MVIYSTSDEVVVTFHKNSSNSTCSPSASENKWGVGRREKKRKNKYQNRKCVVFKIKK